MKLSRRSLLLGFGASALAAARSTSYGPLGLEIYSLRRELAKDIPGTLAMVRKFGFEEVEVPGFYGLSASAFREQLDRASLRCTAMVAEDDQLHKDLSGVIADARALGANYVLYPWIPHEKEFTEDDCRRGAADMNRWGQSLKEAGLKFCYHPHGYEFQPFRAGTLFDLMASLTDPSSVNFQADVFWIAWPGQDPVKLLRRHPTRFALMHLKDIRKGTKLGNLTGHAPEETSVAVGTGMLNFPAILREAKKIGIKRYYIEDEAPEAAQNIPESLKYLKSLWQWTSATNPESRS
jgi:sugar phosphate isomerase/epimerase